MPIERTSIQGFAELERQLTENLPKATQRNVLKKAATQAMDPVRDHAESLAPVRTGKLKASVRIEAGRSFFRGKRSGGALLVQVVSGGGDAFYSRFIEHGTVKMAAQPFMRPAFDGSKGEVISRLKVSLSAEIHKAVGRRARKLAKGTAR